MSQKSFSSRMLVVIMCANNFIYYTMYVYQYYILKIVSLISIASNSMGFFFPFFFETRSVAEFLFGERIQPLEVLQSTAAISWSKHFL